MGAAQSTTIDGVTYANLTQAAFATGFTRSSIEKFRDTGDRSELRINAAARNKGLPPGCPAMSLLSRTPREVHLARWECWAKRMPDAEAARHLTTVAKMPTQTAQYAGWRVFYGLPANRGDVAATSRATNQYQLATTPARPTDKLYGPHLTAVRRKWADALPERVRMMPRTEGEAIMAWFMAGLDLDEAAAVRCDRL